MSFAMGGWEWVPQSYQAVLRPSRPIVFQAHRMPPPFVACGGCPSMSPVQLSCPAPVQEANRRFGEVVLRNYAPGDVVWVQDYHLMLLPALLKLRAPKMKVPLPSPRWAAWQHKVVTSSNACL